MNIIKIIKSVYFGICDYHMDCKHDRILKQVLKIGSKMYSDMVTIDKNGKEKHFWGEAYSWKEGNLFHYIQQRYYALSYFEEIKDNK